MAGYTEELHRQTSAPKGTQQWSEQQHADDGQQTAPKGTRQWAEQVSNSNNGQQEQHRVKAPVAPNGNQSGTKVEPRLSKEEQEQQQAVMGLDQQIAAVHKLTKENTPETEEERKKREKKEKREKLIAAISDGVAAIGNLVTTSMGGISSYNPDKGSQTDAVKGRLHDLKKLREDRKNKWEQLQLDLGKLYDQRAARMREVAAQQAEAKRREREDQRKETNHKWRLKLNEMGYKKAEADAADAANKANISGISAQHAKEMEAAKLATERSKANANNARAGAQNSLSKKYEADAKGEGKGKKEEYVAYDRNNQPHTFTRRDAAVEFARQHETLDRVEVKEIIETETEDIAGKKTRREVKSKVLEYPGVPKKDEGKGESKSDTASSSARQQEKPFMSRRWSQSPWSMSDGASKAKSKGDMPGASKSKGDMPGISKRG